MASSGTYAVNHAWETLRLRRRTSNALYEYACLVVTLVPELAVA